MAPVAVTVDYEQAQGYCELKLLLLERSPHRGEWKPAAPTLQSRCSISPSPERSASPQLQFDPDDEADELVSCDEVMGEDEYEAEEGEISD